MRQTRYSFTLTWGPGQVPQGTRTYRSRTRAERERAAYIRTGYRCGPVTAQKGGA